MKQCNTRAFENTREMYKTLAARVFYFSLMFSNARRVLSQSKGPGRRGHIVADTNVSPFARARNICCGYKFFVWDTKNILILFRIILCPQQMFPSLRAQGNVMSYNFSATMFLRSSGP